MSPGSKGPGFIKSRDLWATNVVSAMILMRPENVRVAPDGELSVKWSVALPHVGLRGRFRNDDETLLVLQREEESLVFMLGEVASSNKLGRLLRSPEKG